MADRGVAGPCPGVLGTRLVRTFPSGGPVVAGKASITGCGRHLGEAARVLSALPCFSPQHAQGQAHVREGAQSSRHAPRAGRAKGHCPCCDTGLLSWKAADRSWRPDACDVRRYEGVPQDAVRPACNSIPRQGSSRGRIAARSAEHGGSLAPHRDPIRRVQRVPCFNCSPPHSAFQPTRTEERAMVIRR